MKVNICVYLFLLFLFVLLDYSAAWRRRRRRRCPVIHCSVSKWTSWNSCTHPCGLDGIQSRTRQKTVSEQCGGQCAYSLTETQACNRDVCQGRGEPRSGACLCFTGFKGTCCKIVSCRYTKCVQSQWTAWVDIYPTPEGKCVSEERTRSYQLVVETVDALNCGDLGPQQCPGPEQENRKKDSFCEPLTPSLNRNFTSATCTSTRQQCGNNCILKCDEDRGYKIQGSEKTTCLQDGTWSDINLQCTDVQEPEIICPADITVTSQNDLSIQINLPPPHSSDNSGETPSITSSVGGYVSSFIVAADPYVVTYTATDSSNNTKSCSFKVTVKSVCLDNDDDCSVWAQQGWCQRSPGIMFPKCCKSCSAPCKDTDANCESWKADGFCERSNPNFGFAKKHCQKTCNACD